MLMAWVCCVLGRHVSELSDAYGLISDIHTKGGAGMCLCPGQPYVGRVPGFTCFEVRKVPTWSVMYLRVGAVYI